MNDKQEEENSDSTAVTSPSVEFLLKQVYIAHKGKVKALEADIHQLKSELLQEKNKEEQCKQCKNLRSMLKRCKAEYSKALSKQKERINLLELQLTSMENIPVTKVNSNPMKRNENLPFNSSGDNELGLACKKIKKDQASKAENLESTNSFEHQKEISGTYTISVFDDDCIKDNIVNLQVQTNCLINDKNDNHSIIVPETVDIDVSKNEKFNQHMKTKEKLTTQTYQPKVIPETLGAECIDEIIDGLSLSSILKGFNSNKHNIRNETESDNIYINQECHPSTSLSTDKKKLSANSYDNSNKDIKMYSISITNEEKIALRNNIRKYFSKTFGERKDLNDNLDASTVKDSSDSQGTGNNQNCIDSPSCEQQKILNSSLLNEISSHADNRCQNERETEILDIDTTYFPLASIVNEKNFPSKHDLPTEDIITLDDDDQNDEIMIIGENISEIRKSQSMLTGDNHLSEKDPSSVANGADECSFDRVPKKIAKYKFKEECVRKQDERRKLPGHDCKQCEQYYKELDLTENERNLRKTTCSRHRAAYSPPPTPEHYWEIDFPDTAECRERGYINETQKVELQSRRRRPLKLKQEK